MPPRAALLLSLLLSNAAWAQNQALVIGNGDYPEAPLSNPVNDARDMAKALTGLGFAVVAKENLGLEAIGQAVREFGDRLRGDDVGLFYFAGHGMQVKGANYLIPVRSGIQREDEVPFHAFNIGEVLAKMESAHNRLNLVILDACRDNPFARGVRGGERGLARMDAPSGTLIAYATKPGSVSLDGGGRNGLYTGHLLQHLATPGLQIEDLFKKVRVEVKHASGEKQIPWEEGGLEGDFCFAGCAVAEAAPVAAPAKPASPPPATSPPPCEYCPEMVKLPGGTFMMGSDDSDPEASSDEKPRHRVTVKAFSLGQYEVTRAQFAAFVDATNYQAQGCYTWDGKSWSMQAGKSWRDPGFPQTASHPAVCVSLEDAQAYIRWLNQKTGQAYRLPTEAEWEYAARAGTGTSRHWGGKAEDACRYANVADQTAKQEFASWEVHECADGYVYTAPAGRFLPNGFGLYDMLGNAWEWTCSEYMDYGNGAESTCITNAKDRRAVRGGSWFTKPGRVRSAYRDWGDPADRDYDLDFRLAQD